MSKTIFVSSTCYDLLDLRAEVELELRKIGLTPVLSDQLTSDFSTAPDENSIETCLVNVRRSDIFVIILSQRYGPSLAKAGYSDESATHLEYREARKQRKPIYMYVRDRLEADYAVWKKNAGKSVAFAWVNGKDTGIFNLMEEHRQLTAKSSKGTNWFWIFRNSVELKQRLRKDLAAESGVAILQDLIERGRVAYLLPEVERFSFETRSRDLVLELKIVNGGTSTAIKPFVSLDTDTREDVQKIPSLVPGESASVTLRTRLTMREVKNREQRGWLTSSYATPEGHWISDECYFEFSWQARQKPSEKPDIEYRGKKYYHSGVMELIAEKREDDC